MKRNIPLFKVTMSDDASSSVVNTLKSGYIGQGDLVEKFEERLRQHFGVDYINTTNSCTSALDLAIQCLDLHWCNHQQEHRHPHKQWGGWFLGLLQFL